MCRTCELNIKRSLKKKDNGKVYNIRNTLAVLHLVPLRFLEEELIGCLACDWLLSAMVSGHHRNKPRQLTYLG